MIGRLGDGEEDLEAVLGGGEPPALDEFGILRRGAYGGIGLGAPRLVFGVEFGPLGFAPGSPSSPGHPGSPPPPKRPYPTAPY